MAAFADHSGTQIGFLRDNGTAIRGHFDLESIAFRKYFHSQQIGALAAGIKVESSFGGVGQGVLGGKKTLKDSSLGILDDAHAVSL